MLQQNQDRPGATGPAAVVVRGHAFVRDGVLPGWSARWGFDPVLEGYWAELLRDGGGPAVRISADHLITTVAGLARAVAFATAVPDTEAYLALTA